MAKRRKKRRREYSESFLDSFVFKLGTKLFLGLAIIVTFLTLTQCTVKKPEAPEWNTNLTVPMINRLFPMEELVDEIGQDEVGFDSSGLASLSITEELDTIRLDADLLTTPDINSVISEKLGTVSISSPSVDPVTVSLTTIAGLASSLPGDSADVAAGSFDLYNDMPTISTFTQATIADGYVDIVIDNNLGIDLDTVIVEIYDNFYSQVIATDTFPQPILHGTSDTSHIPLNNASISNSLRVNSHCYTPGGTVDSASTRAIGTELLFSDSLVVSSATAEIPSFSREYPTTIPLDENNRIDTATLSSGTLNLQIINETNLDADLVITLPDFISSSDIPLSINQHLVGRQSTNTSIDLSQYRLVPQDNTLPQEIQVNVSVSLPGTSQQVQVNADDSFFVDASLTNLAFGSVTGVFDTISADFVNVSQDIDAPTGLDSVQFASALLTLEVENGINLPGHLDVLLQGNNGKSLHFIGDIAPSGYDSTSISTITDSTVADFLYPFPTHIDVTGSVTFGDGLYQGTIKANDFVQARINISAPLALIINETTFETDIQSTEISQDNIDAITDHFISGRLVYNITSHLPLGAQVDLYLGGDSVSIYTTPVKTFDSLSITAAPVSANGIVIDTASTGYQEIYLDSADVRRILENDTLYIGQQITLESTNGQVVKLTQNDYLTITGYLEVEYHFDGEF